MKLAKKSAPRIDDENLDEETLLQMTEDVPLSDDELGPDELEILEDDPDLAEQDNSGLTGIVRFDNDEENPER